MTVTLHEIAELNKKLSASAKRFRQITNQALQDVRPDTLEEILLSLREILTVCEKERKKILSLIIDDDSKPCKN